MIPSSCSNGSESPAPSRWTDSTSAGSSASRSRPTSGGGWLMTAWVPATATPYAWRKPVATETTHPVGRDDAESAVRTRREREVRRDDLVSRIRMPATRGPLDV